MFTILGADGKEYGPVTPGRIQEWITGGRANLQTKARRSSETEWRTLGDFPEFNPAAAEMPPPLAEAATPAIPPLPVAPAASSAVVSADLPPLAGLGWRLGAAFIDGFLQFLCKLPVFFACFAMAKIVLQDPNTPFEQMMAPILEANGRTLPWLALYAAVQSALLCVRSQSVGKLLLGLRIVHAETGQPAGPLRAFLLRGFIPAVIEMIPVLGFLFWVVDSCFIFREDHRCVHDLLAGTKVVKR